MTTRRIVRVAVADSYLIQTIRKSYRLTAKVLLCDEGLPDDAEYTGSYTDFPSNTGYLLFTHPSFAEVKQGDDIPILPIRHRVILQFKNPFLKFLSFLIDKLIGLGLQ